ncbi:MAG: 3-deoxy-7-phosphoheptulonate synthase [Planctomycetes bacterium]|nr:3-deoxy-7-phosphoheptulonate synthase [Planctomycetota bacterium]
MIVVLKRHATQEQVERMARRVEELGLKAHVIVGTERTVIAAIGEKRNGEQQKLESCEEVERVVPILAPYKVASVETKPEPTVVRALDLAVGGGHIGMIAGPCSVEGEEQIMQVARQVKEAGAKGLRGGAFKPRTSPYSFQGLKEKGLELLAAAREETGLAVVTEVMTPGHVEMVARYADVLQIGARNMQNYHLLQAVGEVPRPVLLKRGPSATMDEFLLAAEYILDQGNQQVILCERGIRTFETHTRFTLPLATVPYLKQRTHLPVMVDPSHGTGIASLVPSMCTAAIAAGCDGLLIEVHPDPSKAVSDGAQTITPAVFAQTLEQCRKVAAALGRGEG